MKRGRKSWNHYLGSGRSNGCFPVGSCRSSSCPSDSCSRRRCSRSTLLLCWSKARNQLNVPTTSSESWTLFNPQRLINHTHFKLFSIKIPLEQSWTLPAELGGAMLYGRMHKYEWNSRTMLARGSLLFHAPLSTSLSACVVHSNGFIFFLIFSCETDRREFLKQRFIDSRSIRTP